MKFATRLFAGLACGALLVASAVAGEGKAVSTINTDMYTYVEVSVADKNIWIAGPLVEVKPGSTVSFDDGPLMSNFHSKQLNRTFPSVMFVQQIKVAAEK